MIVPFLLFWGLIGWSLYDGDLYPREGFTLIGIWVALLIIFLIFQVSFFWFVVPTVLLDIYLILKVFGRDIRIR